MIVLELSRSSHGFRIEFYTAMWSSGTELGIQLQNRTVLGQEYKPKLSEEEIYFEWFLCHGIFLITRLFWFEAFIFYFYLHPMVPTTTTWLRISVLSISNQFQFEPACWFFIRSQVTYFHSWKQWKYGKQSWHTSYPFKLITSFVCT